MIKAGAIIAAACALLLLNACGGAEPSSQAGFNDGGGDRAPEQAAAGQIAAPADGIEAETLDARIARLKEEVDALRAQTATVDSLARDDMAVVTMPTAGRAASSPRTAIAARTATAARAATAERTATSAPSLPSARSAASLRSAAALAANPSRAAAARIAAASPPPVEHQRSAATPAARLQARLAPNGVLLPSPPSGVPKLGYAVSGEF